MTSEQDPLTQAVISGRREEVKRLTREYLAKGNSATQILEKKLIPGMTIVGELFRNNEIFVPEMLIAARAVKEAFKILESTTVFTEDMQENIAIMGTVEGDLHDIGKNLVIMMWRSANICVVDLGVNVPPARFTEAIRDYDAKIVGISALLTTTMPAMRDTVRAIRHAGLAVKIIVGGAPITAQFAKSIGADAYAPDAGIAVDMALDLLRTSVN